MTTAFDEISTVWYIDHNFLSANAPISWEGLSPEKIEALDGRLKDTTGPHIPAELRSTLLAALTRWHKDPIENFAELSPNFLVGSAPPLPTAAAQRTSQTEVAQFYAKGDYTGCREGLKLALPKLLLQHSLLLAECAYDSGDFRTSFLAAEQALSADAQSPAAWYWRIKASEVLALNALLQAGLAGPTSPAVHVMLGDVYRDRKNFEQAEAEYRQAIELEPRDVAAYFGLAATFYRAFRYEKALPELRTVLQLAPQNPEANFMMADILAYHHEFAHAEPYARAALHGTRSNLPLVHALLSKIYASQGLTTKAIKQVQQALPVDDDGSLHYQIAMLYKRVGDVSAERAALKESETLRQNREKRVEETMESVER